MNTKISQIKTDNLQALKDRDSNKKSILQILLTTFDNERVKLGYKTTSELSNDEVDRKSTRLNSSHITISYAVFCLKKKKNKIQTN